MSDTNDEATLCMKVIGIILMVFAIWGIVEAVIGFVRPAMLGLDQASLAAAATARGADISGATSITSGIVTGAMIAMLVFSLIEFYFGLIAFKGRPTKLAAIVCLVIGVLAVLGAISTLVVGAANVWALISEAGSAIIAIMYYYYYHKMNA